WLDGGERRGDGLARARRIDACSLERLRDGGKRERRSGDRTDAEGEPPAPAVGFERDLRRRGGEGEIASARIDLVEAHADARLSPERKAHGDEARRGRQCRHHRPEKEFVRRNL